MSMLSINGVIYGSVLVAAFYATRLIAANKFEDIIAKKA